jgi:hypothetical protein
MRRMTLLPSARGAVERPKLLEGDLMLATLSLSNDSRTTAGILLMTILAVEFGGITMLRIVRGRHQATEFQKSFARAGHAHAGGPGEIGLLNS